jgi:hypothetical protein
MRGLMNLETIGGRAEDFARRALGGELCNSQDSR